jgi:hypothetical protein
MGTVLDTIMDYKRREVVAAKAALEKVAPDFIDDRRITEVHWMVLRIRVSDQGVTLAWQSQ